MNRHLYIIFLIMFMACTAKKREDASMNSMLGMANMPGVKDQQTGKRNDSKSEHNADLPLDSLLGSTNQFIISSIPVTALFSAENNTEINVLGTVAYDYREIHGIASRIEGRIEKLYVRYKYQHINKGQKLFDIYSPELLTSQQNYLFLLKNDRNNETMISAAKQRLLLQGMTPVQLQQLSLSGKPIVSVSVYSNYSGVVVDPILNESQSSTQSMSNLNTSQPSTSIPEELQMKEGMYLQKGQSVFSVINSDKVILRLNIYADHGSSIKKGNKVTIIPETDPSKKINGTIDFIEPIISSQTNTIQARMYFDNSKYKLPIGSPVTGKIYVASGSGYWVLSSSVISTGLKNIVFKKVKGGFVPHQVIVGDRTTDKIQIISGLGVKDSIALNAQQLLASQSTIK